MNSKSLQKYIDKNRNIFEDLSKCGSVSELLIKQIAYGQNWNRWSWGVFIYFIWHQLLINHVYKSADDFCQNCLLLKDILQTIDEGTELDSIMTNKIVIKSILQIIDLDNAALNHIKRNSTSEYGNILKYGGLLCVLAHIFNKFPDLWNVSWMFIRHTTLNKKAIRTHRLKYLISDISKDPMQDFINNFFKLEKIVI